MNPLSFFRAIVLHSFIALVFFAGAATALANLPGGGTNGANVTLTDNGTTVTIANGILSIVCNKSSGQVTTINYTFNNTGSSQTLNLISGNPNGGKLYWENSNNEGLTFTYSLISNPAANGGNYAEIALSSTTVSNVVMEVHYSLLRGSSGFYVTPIFIHRSSDGAFGMGECRDNIYAGSIFNWMSVDAARNRVMEVSGGSAIGVQGAPVEVSLWINGIYSGQYEDKYKYGANFGLQRVWGWSSVGAGGKNVGLWNVSGSVEYYNGGPMKRELMEHLGTTVLNMINGGHYGSNGQDGNWAAGEVWSKVYGPYFIYCNNITNTITSTSLAAQALYADAKAQALAEQGIDTNGQPTGAVGAWPYYWFTNAYYAPAANRGTVTGKIFINDIYNPNASESNLWVGLVQQPSTTTATYDFQKWVKPYQFWVKTDANGNFTIPNVIATNNYTLYAFGPGAAGTFQSQNQTGGNTPNTINLPASPFSVTVTGGATNNLGTVTWTPTRVGPTVFEIGFPNRTGDKFKHGDDWWVGDIGPNAANPSPIWSKWLEYQFDYPSGPNYTVGQSRWTTDWNFIQPCVTDSAGNYNGSTSTINFNLPSAPVGAASFYIALSSDDSGPLIIQVNGNNIAGSNGYSPNYSGSTDDSDVTIRESNHGIYSDARFSISSGFLHQGQNTITLNMRKGGASVNHAMYDYIRLELAGYIPPPPVSVAAYAGNNCNLVCWPVTPGATSYNILRSTNSGSGYVSITNGVTGPVCGSGPNNATYLDTNAVNDTTYYYVVRSVNPTGSSTNSPESTSITPSAALSTSVPSAPTGLIVSGSGHHAVTLSWSASSGANFYSVFRSTLANTGGGSSNTLSTIILNNATTNTIYTDNSPTDGSIYSYSVTATSAGGTCSNSTSAVAVPLPASPATAPGSLTASPLQVTNITLNWSAVSGAVGYVVSRATSFNGTYTLLNSITETTYTDVGLSTNTTYYYKVTPVNAAGTATSGLTTTRPAAPASLTAVAGNAQAALTWPASIGATGYIVLLGSNSGNATNVIVSGITSTNYTSTGLTNGATYYYVVQAIGSAATSGNSPQASASPPILNLTWSGAASAVWDTTASNWLNGAAAINYANGDTVIFNDTTRTNILITASTSPSSVIFANTNANYSLSATGAGISGATSLLKTGAGTLTLASSNSYSGGTIVNGGTLLVNNAGGTGLGTVTIDNGGTLGGNGIISGAVTVNSGGGFAPGNPLGTLTIGNNLTLAGGSTTFAQVQHTPLTNNVAQIVGTLFEGGTLIVTNVGVTAIAAGDSFVLFNAASYSGTFGSVMLPSLTAGLVWNTGALNTSGMLSVSKSTPVLQTAPAASAISYGQTLSASILSGGMFTNTAGAVVPGAFAFAATNTMPDAGTSNQPVTFTPADTNDYYMPATFNVSVTVNPLAAILTGVRVYDGTTNAAFGILSVADKVGDDDVAATSGTIGLAAAMVGTNSITSLGNLALGGTTAGNYTLAGASGSVIITQAVPSLIMTSAANPSAYKANVTFNATVAGVDTPTGTVQFLANGAAFDNEPLAGGMAASAATTLLPPGTNVITAAYSGDVNYLPGTNLLNQVVKVAQFDVINLGENGLVLGGFGGAPDATYYVLISTNMTVPFTSWTPIMTNQFDNNGNFNFTNLVDPDAPQSFYRIQLQ